MTNENIKTDEILKAIKTADRHQIIMGIAQAYCNDNRNTGRVYKDYIDIYRKFKGQLKDEDFN